MSDEQEARMIAAHKLGKRDAQLGHAESWPPRPFESYELESYHAGYVCERQRMKMKNQRQTETGE